ncbi:MULTISPECIES: 4Fe-4S dicluster domain-containing protein [unclassified Desulfovibrio]|uniref:GltB/FmdC/FwdC-like GXGXG domain-containing protein n=1 Tax=unclassified Desulfovibrio TaxID=2593640 RepID=UPI002FDB6B22
MLRMNTLHNHERMSTQDLLLAIEDAVDRGETVFHIEASGQHDIGGPLWNRDGKKLMFTVSNPGQRVGSMCLPDTEVLVEGSAAADVGWLNAGGRITVRGDAGDTAGHCAAAGVIYIGGRAGTRSGSLMKHDPMYEPPELWVLKSVGSFSFEFMGGGRAVVCGYESQTMPSILGERPCVGMVGGAVYFRGPVGNLSPDVRVSALTGQDLAWLEAGLESFLAAIDKPQLHKELSVWKHWKKIVPVPQEQDEHKGVQQMAQFRAEEWIKNGIFSDVAPDDFAVNGLVAVGDYRLRVPAWENRGHAGDGSSACSLSVSGPCRDCKICIKSCPQKAIRRKQVNEGFDYAADPARCIGCGICAAVCPCGVWRMHASQDMCAGG